MKILMFLIMSTLITLSAFADADISKPIIKIDPLYSQSALKAGISGWCKVEFIIQGDGSTANVTPIECIPERIFDRSSKKAINKWKYKPVIENGQPVARKARVLVNFDNQTKNTTTSIIEIKNLSDSEYASLSIPKKSVPTSHPEALKTQKDEKEKNLKEIEFSKVLKASKCNLKNENWAYLKGNCKNGFADGQGSSINREGIKFIGVFKSGERVKGDITQGDEMIFSGVFLNDKPNGNGICLFEGEYEECRFFRGKRIDTLYKIRKENAKNLTQMEKLKHGRDQNLQHLKNNVMIDALEEEATKRAASFIFDKLF